MELPFAFVQRTQPILGNDFEKFIDALASTSPTSIRVNDKISYIPSSDLVPWCDAAYYLMERPSFTADPLFHAGVYYVQEASSMFLYQAIKQYFPSARTVLDLCAAPGGKSTLLTQVLPKSSLLVSNEIIRPRAYILAENMIKWGNPNVFVSNNKPEDFQALPGFFDAIVIDAPCSGEGMFRKDPGAINEWSEQLVELCRQRQRKIIEVVWDSLKPDGILVYSTCTYNREENEQNIQWICNQLDAEVLKLDLQGNNHIVESENGYRFYPHKIKGEGFFLSVLRKGALTKSSRIKSGKSKKSSKGNKIVFPYQLKDSEYWELQVGNSFLRAYDKERVDDFNILNEKLNCLHAGILLGEQKFTDFIPSISLALSKQLDQQSVEKIDLNDETAISYLRREAIYLPDSKKGFLLVCFQGVPLGWVKNIGNRCNNLYPSEWRIRMKI